jgi:MYXO-CTERM domain-containing protein
LPSGDAGGVIWFRESTFADSAGGAPAEDVLAFQILYLSTTALGERNAVSGTLLVPRAPYPGGPRPIVGYGVGTQGMGDACAASKGLVSGGTYDSGFARSALDRGWAVAVSDYEGLGTPGEHTYVVNLSLGHAVIDSVRAAQRIPEAGLGEDSPVVFWGYSEGGAAVAAAAELAPSYAAELHVVAVASGAAPSDLIASGRYQDGQLGFGSVFIAGLGYQAAYPELQLTSNLNELGRSEGEWAKNACILDIIARFSGRKMSDYTLADPLTNDAFVARLEENRLGRRNPRVPVYLYHGEVDQVIPLAVGEALRDAYCAGGASVSWVTYPGAEHVLGQTQGFEAAEAWLAERLDGVPATTVCPPGAGADGGADARRNAPGGDGGCSASSAKAPPSFWLAAIAVFAMVARRRSRRGHGLLSRSTPSVSSTRHTRP